MTCHSACWSEDGADETNDGVIVGEDADHVAAALPTEAADAHVKTLEIGKPVHISG